MNNPALDSRIAVMADATTIGRVPLPRWARLPVWG